MSMDSVTDEIQQLTLLVLTGSRAQAREYVLEHTSAADFPNAHASAIRARVQVLCDAGKPPDLAEIRGDHTLSESARSYLDRPDLAADAQTASKEMVTSWITVLRQGANERKTIRTIIDIVGNARLSSGEKWQKMTKALNELSNDNGEIDYKGALFEGETYYYKYNMKTKRQVAVSSFRIEPHAWVECAAGGPSGLDATLVAAESRTRLQLPKDAFGGSTKFKASLPDRVRHRWAGSDAEVEGVLGCVDAHDVPRVLGSDVLGYNDQTAVPVYLGSDGVITGDGYVPSHDAPIRYWGDGANNYPLQWPEPDANLGELVQALTELHPHSWQLLGWFAAAPLRPRILRELGHAPLLAVHGEPGSGKTSFCLMLARTVAGMSREFNVTATQFSLLKLLSGCNAYPLILDEFKPANLSSYAVRVVNSIVNSNYTESAVPRGRADQKLNTYPLRAPTVICGERAPSDSAWLDRSIVVPMSPDHLDAQNKMTYALLERADVAQLARPFLQHCLSFELDLENARFRVDATGIETGSRVRDSIAVALEGCRCWHSFAEGIGVKLQRPKLQELVAPMITAVHGGRAKGRAVPTVHRVLALITRLIVTQKIDHGWRWIEGGGLAVNIPVIVDAYCGHVQRLDGQHETPDALCKVLQSELRPPLCVDRKSVRIGKASLYCHIIDQRHALEAIEGYCTVEKGTTYGKQTAMQIKDYEPM